MILDYVQRIIFDLHCCKLFWTSLHHSCHESAKDAQFLLTENFLNRHCLLPPSLRERPVITDNWGDCFSSRGVVHPWTRNAQQRQTLMVRCAFLGGSCLWIWTQFRLDKLDNLGTLMSASLKCEGTFKEKTKSWNGIVHVKGIWKFVSNLNFAKCRWKREKERKEFLTWCNICIQHSINCARVQTSLFCFKDGFFLGNCKKFPVEVKLGWTSPQNLWFPINKILCLTLLFVLLAHYFYS